MPLPTAVERWYVRRLQRRVTHGTLPRHVALIMDGNRRWAREAGLADERLGHAAGAEHLGRVLEWCAEVGIAHVTIFVCSTENLVRRHDAEVANLMTLIEDVILPGLVAPGPRWRLHLAGMIDALPTRTALALKDAVEATRACPTGAHVTLAIGYGGRQEVADAIRSLMVERAEAGQTPAEMAATLTDEDIARHLYTAGQPDVDLVIRTSGEQRLSNFLLWQTTRSELFFCEAHWPAFRKIDLLRALRTYGEREQPAGGDLGTR